MRVAELLAECIVRLRTGHELIDPCFELLQYGFGPRLSQAVPLCIRNVSHEC
jgi:hypothetical protein